jgi:8-oxo-dGTP diphosphatase
MPGGRPQTPLLTVDALIVDEEHGLVLIQRRHEPFRGSWALPGGFVELGESCESACVREVEEETGLRVEVKQLLDVMSEPGRDPRGHVVSVLYSCEVVGGRLRAGDDASSAAWLKHLDAVELAFDHEQVLRRFARDLC